MAPNSGLTDRFISVSTTQTLRDQLEIARRELGERSISATVRRFCVIGLGTMALEEETSAN